jgi:hypothetical protein
LCRERTYLREAKQNPRSNFTGHDTAVQLSERKRAIAGNKYSVQLKRVALE